MQQMTLSHKGELALSEADAVGFIAPKIEAYLSELSVTPKTKAIYAHALARFMAFLEGKRLSDLTRALLVNYRQQLMERMAARSVNLYLSPIRAFFTWMEASTLFPNITGGLKGLKLPKEHARDSLSVEQCRAWLTMVDSQSACLIGKRNRAIVFSLLFTGIRAVEILRANVEDIGEHAGMPVLYIHGKGRNTKDEYVFLKPVVLSAINCYLEARKERDRVFPKDPLFVGHSPRNTEERLTTQHIEHVVKGLLRAAGFDSPRLSTHSLRHTFASIALQNGAPLESIQAALRHSSVTTTQIYARALGRSMDAAEGYIRF